LETPVQMER